MCGRGHGAGVASSAARIASVAACRRLVDRPARDPQGRCHLVGSHPQQVSAARGPRDGPPTAAASLAPTGHDRPRRRRHPLPSVRPRARGHRSMSTSAAAWPPRSRRGRAGGRTMPRTSRVAQATAPCARCRATPAGSHPLPRRGRPTRCRPPGAAVGSRWSPAPRRHAGRLVVPEPRGLGPCPHIPWPTTIVAAGGDRVTSGPL